MVKTRKTRRPKRVRRLHKKTRRGGGFFDFFKQSKVAPEPNTIPPLSERPANIKQLSDNEAKRLSEIEDELDELTAAKDKDVNKIEQLKKEQRELTEKSLQPMQQNGSNQYASIFAKCKRSTFNQAFSSGDCNTLKKNYKPEFQLIDNNYNDLKRFVVRDLKKYVDKEFIDNGPEPIPYYMAENIGGLVNIYKKIVDRIINEYEIGTSDTLQIIKKMPYTKDKAFVYYPAKKYLRESDIQYFCFAVYDLISIHKQINPKNLWYRIRKVDNVPFGPRDPLTDFAEYVVAVLLGQNKLDETICKNERITCYYNGLSLTSTPGNSDFVDIDKNDRPINTEVNNNKIFYNEPETEEEEDYGPDDIPVREDMKSINQASNDAYRLSAHQIEYLEDIPTTPTPISVPVQPQAPPPQPPMKSRTVDRRKVEPEPLPTTPYNVLKPQAMPANIKSEDLLKVINLSSKTGKPRISSVYREALAEEKRKCNEYNYNLRNYFNCSKVNRTSIAESDEDLMRRLPKGGARRTRRTRRRTSRHRRTHRHSKRN
jgi:hypothetical protein